MSKIAFVLCVLWTLAYPGSAVKAAVIWSGGDVVFNRAAGVDWTLSANQDRITSDVWLTRGATKGLFNIAQESTYSNTLSPTGTEWAYGVSANIASLTFKDWESWHGKNPGSSVGQNAVLHLTGSDIYIDIKFLSWDIAGGAFSYVRSTPEPGGLGSLAIGLAAMLLRRRRSLGNNPPARAN